MKKLVKMFALMMISSMAMAQHGLVDQTPVDRNLRFGVVYDNEATPSGGSATGFEIGYGQEILPLDQMALTFSHVSKGPVEHNSVVLTFEEHYKLAAQLKLYGTSGIGYMSTDIDNASSREGIFAKLGLGLLLETCSRSALYAEVSYLFGARDLWMDGKSLDDHNLLVSAGLRWKY